MAAVFSNVFSCCLHRKPSKPKIVPDEESHLIPGNNEIIPSSAAHDGSIIPQPFKERMAHIVRTKENKMVNVASRMPFNIQNKIYSSLADASLEEGTKVAQAGHSSASASPSYSRSGSALSLPPSARFQSHFRHTYPIPPSPLSPLSPIHNPKTRRPNLSRSSSLAFSRIPDEFYSDPYLGEEENHEARDESNSESGSRSRMGSSSRGYRSPPFRVRLVRGFGTPSSTASALATRRGRAKRRTQPNESSSPEVHKSEQPNTPASAGQVPGRTDSDVGPLPPSEIDLSVSPSSTSSPSVASTSKSMPHFELQTSGSLVVGWDNNVD